MDAVQQGHPPVGQVEHHRILVGDPVGPDQPRAVLLQEEPLGLRRVGEPMRADPPRLRRVAREVGVGHDQVVVAVAVADPLDARVLDAFDPDPPGAGQDIAEPVVDVGDA